MVPTIYAGPLIDAHHHPRDVTLKKHPTRIPEKRCVPAAGGAYPLPLCTARTASSAGCAIPAASGLAIAWVVVASICKV
jgi:hypothetical protein